MGVPAKTKYRIRYTLVLFASHGDVLLHIAYYLTHAKQNDTVSPISKDIQ